jgi:hypothetical protein
VGRNPKKTHPDDLLFLRNLLDAETVLVKLENTEIAYLTLGLPYDSEIWLRLGQNNGKRNCWLQTKQL